MTRPPPIDRVPNLATSREGEAERQGGGSYTGANASNSQRPPLLNCIFQVEVASYFSLKKSL